MAKLTNHYQIGNYIDTFALGHYARVMEALDLRNGEIVAFKVMRPEHLQSGGDAAWEFRAFGNEAEILLKLADSPYVVKLRDCGYVSSTDESPVDGDVESFGLNINAFNHSMLEYAGQGWRPYLSLENLPRAHSLFYLMKPTQAGVRWRLPSEEGLALALQFAQTLKLAHLQNIVYLDHKLEHVYWDGVKLQIIDFNSSKQLKGDAGDSQQIRSDVHNLCVGVLYPLFTGMSPQKTTLRPQPGTREQVEARYADIRELDFNMEPTLSHALRDLLRRGAEMQIEDVDEFIGELNRVAALHGWDFPHHYTSPASRDGRDHLRAGLKRLREGQTQIREARDLIREAVIQDGITVDLEEELRRLLKSINEMLNHRVIP